MNTNFKANIIEENAQEIITSLEASERPSSERMQELKAHLELLPVRKVTPFKERFTNAQRFHDTEVDWTEYDLITILGQLEGCAQIWELRVPGTPGNFVRFTSVSGITLVTGDYGIWTFFGERYPEATKEDLPRTAWLHRPLAPENGQPEEMAAIVDAYREICYRLKDDLLGEGEKDERK